MQCFQTVLSLWLLILLIISCVSDQCTVEIIFIYSRGKSVLVGSMYFAQSAGQKLQARPAPPTVATTLPQIHWRICLFTFPLPLLLRDDTSKSSSLSESALSISPASGMSSTASISLNNSSWSLSTKFVDVSGWLESVSVKPDISWIVSIPSEVIRRHCVHNNKGTCGLSNEIYFNYIW